MNTSLFPHRVRRRPAAGFTLLELMVVVVIVGLLAAIGYPAYTSHIQKGRRADAESMLLQGAQYLQRYYAAKNTFKDAKLPATYALAPAGASDASSTGYYYKITLAVGSDERSYTLKATPNSSLFTDSQCGFLTLDDTGKKGTEYGTVDKCWR